MCVWIYMCSYVCYMCIAACRDVHTLSMLISASTRIFSQTGCIPFACAPCTNRMHPVCVGGVISCTNGMHLVCVGAAMPFSNRMHRVCMPEQHMYKTALAPSAEVFVAMSSASAWLAPLLEPRRLAACTVAAPADNLYLKGLFIGLSQTSLDTHIFKSKKRSHSTCRSAPRPGRSADSTNVNLMLL